MIIFSLIKSAFTSLAVNKLRTFLTILGIVIGILSVITLLNLGEAARKQIETSVSSIGSNTISINPGRIRSSSGFSFNTSLYFKMSEVKALLETPKYFVSGVASFSNQVAKVQYSANAENLTIIGIYGDFWDVRNIVVQQGRPITSREIDGMEKVAVIGPDVIEKIFGGEAPLGKKIKINNQFFTVIGVTEAQGSTGFQNTDASIYIPLTTQQEYLSGNDNVAMLLAKAKDAKYLIPAQEELYEILARIRGIKEGEEADFTISNAQQALSILDQITGILTAFLAAIGAISLLVGGIGIMNIMFVTVNERTKEIGLRKSLGATKNDILLQFLTEAVVVTLLGGILGTAFGLALTYLITVLASLPFVISTVSIVLAVGVSATIGLIFGIYPAWKAAQLSPIDALRYE